MNATSVELTSPIQGNADKRRWHRWSLYVGRICAWRSVVFSTVLPFTSLWSHSVFVPNQALHVSTVLSLGCVGYRCPSAATRSRNRSWCRVEEDVGVPRDPLPAGKIQVCEWVSGDTTHYAIRSDNDRLLVAGRSFRADTLRLDTVADSIRAFLSREFGPESDCRSDIAPGLLTGRVRLWRWQAGQQTIILRISSQHLSLVPESSGIVALEWQRRAVPCTYFIGVPTRID